MIDQGARLRDRWQVGWLVVTWAAVLGIAFYASNADARIAERAQDAVHGQSPSDRGPSGGVLSFNLARCEE